MMAKHVCLFLLVVVFRDVYCQSSKEEVGYEILYKSNTDELFNVTMNFTGKAPSWLHGTLVRVGPGQFEIEKDKKSYVTNSLDGFAKVALWKFVGNNSLLFSTKFINSTYYTESLAQQQFTSNIFVSPPKPQLSEPQLERCLEVGRDNMDINIVDFQDPKTKSVNYVATNDIWSVYEISLDDLSTLRNVTPLISDATGSIRQESPAFIKQLSTSHPLPEPNTDNNRINILLQAALNPGEVNMLKVIRIKSLDQTEVIASWEIPEIPFLHSFSVSQTKIAILMNPYVLNVTCTLNSSVDCYYWKPGNDSITLYVVDLHTGNVRDLKVPRLFVYHHINAFDESEDHLVIDVVSHLSPVPVKKLELDTIRSSDKRKKIDPEADMKRLHVFLSNTTVIVTSLPSPNKESIVASTLDFPVINELNRSRSYCFVYGIVEKLDGKNFGFMGVAKKDLCTNDTRQADALYKREGWYPSEPTFVASPLATAEDDGVLLVPYTSGEDKLTYLVILNATDLTLIDMAKGPIWIPQSQHGKYFEI